MPNIKIRAPQDFVAAVIFLLVGIVGLYLGANLAGMKAGSQLGSGSLPRVLCVILIGFGVFMLVKSLSKDGPPISPIPWRAVVLISLSIVGFGSMIELVGYIPAAICAPFVASFALKENRWRESAIFSALLAIGAALLFITALGQPLRYFGVQ